MLCRGPISSSPKYPRGSAVGRGGRQPPSSPKDRRGAASRATAILLKGEGVSASFPLKRNRQCRVLGCACGPHHPCRFRFTPILSRSPLGRGKRALTLPLMMTKAWGRGAPWINENGEKIMPIQERLEAKAIKRILDARTREVVGWLYEWNTGEILPRWKDGRREKVIYE